MDAFEEMLRDHLPILRRYVCFRISSRFDAEDTLQEICMAAAAGRHAVQNPLAFKGWLLAIARNKCADYYRAKARGREVPLEAVPRRSGAYDREARNAVAETLTRLNGRERQILALFYLRDWPMDKIAQTLGLPLGTVKSRLHYARKRFREAYPFPPQKKGDILMSKMPDIMPDYSIEPSLETPFPVRWEEMTGWFIVPRLGEKLTWAMYDFPEKKRTEQCEMQVLGRAEVHGIEGVEIKATETEPMECNSAGGQQCVERHFVAQLTDTHCRILAESHMEDGVKRFYTFLDGAPFLNSWGFGEDNCGNEILLRPKGDILREGNRVTTAEKTFLLDIVGRYQVTIRGKTYDTVCVMDCWTYDEGMASEQYLDRSGRTVLWRRFNRDDWRRDRYHKPWSELLPDNERITINGQTFVHWYDCITDHILK